MAFGNSKKNPLELTRSEAAKFALKIKANGMGTIKRDGARFWVRFMSENQIEKLITKSVAASVTAAILVGKYTNLVVGQKPMGAVKRYILTGPESVINQVLQEVAA